MTKGDFGYCEEPLHKELDVVPRVPQMLLVSPVRDEKAKTDRIYANQITNLHKMCKS
jgi:hypothetical protein